MGSSFIEYRGYGFWAGDPKIEDWLQVLCTEIDRADDAPAWLLAARDDWHRQATVGFVGCVSPSLDHHLGSDEDRVTRVLVLGAHARDRVQPHVLPVADAFLALLRGEISWDAASSPVL